MKLAYICLFIGINLLTVACQNSVEQKYVGRWKSECEGQIPGLLVFNPNGSFEQKTVNKGFFSMEHKHFGTYEVTRNYLTLKYEKSDIEVLEKNKVETSREITWINNNTFEHSNNSIKCLAIRLPKE